MIRKWTPLLLLISLISIYGSPRRTALFSKPEPRVHLSVERTPLEKVLNMIVGYSGKKLVLDANLRDTTTLSLTGVSWREALRTLKSAHNFEIVETEKLIIISSAPKARPSASLPKPPRVAVSSPSHTKPSIRITGITGNDQERIAIVEVEGSNKLWKVGSSAPGGFKVSKIEEDSIILSHDLRKERVEIPF